MAALPERFVRAISDAAAALPDKGLRTVIGITTGLRSYLPVLSAGRAVHGPVRDFNRAAGGLCALAQLGLLRRGQAS